VVLLNNFTAQVGACIVQERVIVGIDVGTTKICVLVGELDRDGKLNIVGVGTCPSQGLRRGVVVNIEETVTSIAAALDRAERLSGKKNHHCIRGDCWQSHCL